MKRLLLLMLAFLMVVLTSCGQKQEPAPSENTTPPVQSQAPADTTVPSDIPTSGESAEPSTEPSQEPSSEIVEKADMTVSSSGIADNTISDEYGMRGQQQKDGVPTRSIPLLIEDAPDGTVCYAVIMLDPDSVPLCGYEWVHWLAVNITDAEIARNASTDNAANMAQGKNDFGTMGYGGPTPPDKPHTYKITVYALDTELNLQNGFSKDQLLDAMDGHVLAQASLDAKYSN